MKIWIRVATVPALAVLALAAPGCHHANPSATPHPPASPPPLSRPAAPAGLSLAEAEKLVAEVVPRVEAIRGLKFKRPVPVAVVDALTAREHFNLRAQRFWPPDQIRIEQRAFAQLGLIPPGTDLLAQLLDVLQEQAAGYYDPETGTFFVVSNMPRALGPIIIAHELTHALDDQYFGLDTLIEQARADDDRSQALGAVVEGAGTLVMDVFMIQEIGAGRMAPDVLSELQQTDAGRADKLRAAGAFLQRSLVASYSLGQTFLLRGNPMALLTGANPADIDHAYRDPPVSTEQILHPEKYWDAAKRDLPRPVVLGDLAGRLGPGWSLAASGSLGELSLAVLVGASAIDLSSPAAAQPAAWTNAAASGAGGDCYQHYVKGSQAVTILATLWDRERDASEFEHGLIPVPGRKSWRRGDAVVLIAGDMGKSGEALAAEVLKAIGPASIPQPR